ncbi:MAG: WD40 repeat domain-containing serine/threonine protein kinase, partial [Planctomycetota bacterium]
LRGLTDGESRQPPSDDRPELPDSPAEDDPLDFLQPCDGPGRLGKLGPYEVLDVIGRGGMGVVLRAHDPKLNRVVAAKVLAPEFAANATARKRFLQEAQAAAAVSHPHVVTIHAVDETDKTPYLVMEYVDGLSLQDKIERVGHLELKEILRIGVQIAGGLAAAHAHGLIHRDIKPGNVLLENGVERVRITDFGLAQAVDDVAWSRAGEVAGTPQFMSPEQTQGHTVDQRSDLFSLGCVLYAMCTGRSPFRAESTAAVIRRVCDDTPRPIREIHPEIPHWLEEIVGRLLAKRPEDRFASASEVADLLGRHLAHVQDPGSTPFPGPPPHAGRRGLARRRSGWLIAVAVLLAVVGLGLTEVTGVTHIAEYVGTVLRIRTPQGTLILETAEQPLAVGEDVIAEVQRFPGHPASVFSLAVSPSGNMVASASSRGIHVSDCTTGKLIHALRDGTVRLWSVETGDLVRRFERHEGWAACVDVSPDGRTIVSGGRDGTIRLWNRNTGEELLKLDARTELVWDVQLFPDGRRLLAAGNDGSVRVWQMETDGEAVVGVSEMKQLSANAEAVYCARLSDDGRLAVTGGTDNAARIWDVGTGRRLHTLWHVRDVTSAKLTSDGRHVVTGCRDKAIRVWSVETGARVTLGRASTYCTLYAAIAPDGRHVLSAGGLNFDHDKSQWIGDGDYDLHVWRLPESMWPKDGRLAVDPVEAAASEPAEPDALAPALRFREIARFDGYAHQVFSLSFSSDGRRALMGPGHPINNPTAADGSGFDVRLYDLESRRELRRLSGHSSPVLCVAFSPDDRFALTSDLHTIRVWDAESGSELRSFEGAPGPFDCVTFSGDGRRALSGGSDRIVRLWNVDTGEQICQLAGHTEFVWTAAILPDGRRALSAGGGVYRDRVYQPGLDHTIWMWDVESRQVLRRFRGHTGIVERVALSPDGRRALTASYDRTVRLWDVESGEEICCLRGHTANLSGVVFHPDGRHALSTGHYPDGTMRLWDLETGTEICAVGAHSKGVRSVAVSPDGRYAISGGKGDGAVRLWQLPERTAESEKPSAGAHPAEEKSMRTEDGKTKAERSGHVSESPDQPSAKDESGRADR